MDFRALKAGESDAYEADVEEKGDWDLLKIAAGPDSDQCASIQAFYEHLAEICETANLSLPKYVFDLIHLAMSSVTTLSVFRVFIRQGGALEGTLETSNEDSRAPASHNASKD